VRENAAGKRSAGSRKTRSVHNATPIFNPQREKKIAAGSRKTRSVHNATPIFNPQREKKIAACSR
jgi:chorismate mutase